MKRELVTPMVFVPQFSQGARLDRPVILLLTVCLVFPFLLQEDAYLRLAPRKLASRKEVSMSVSA